jgi:hypothetical protein
VLRKLSSPCSWFTFPSMESSLQQNSNIVWPLSPLIFLAFGGLTGEMPAAILSQFSWTLGTISAHWCNEEITPLLKALAVMIGFGHTCLACTLLRIDWLWWEKPCASCPTLARNSLVWMSVPIVTVHWGYSTTLPFC